MDSASSPSPSEDTSYQAFLACPLSSVSQDAAADAAGRAPPAPADRSGPPSVGVRDERPTLVDSDEVPSVDCTLAEDDAMQIYSNFMTGSDPPVGPWDDSLMALMGEVQGGTLEDGGNAEAALFRQPWDPSSSSRTLIQLLGTSSSGGGAGMMDNVEFAATTIDQGLVSDSPAEGAFGQSGHASALGAPATAAALQNLALEAPSLLPTNNSATSSLGCSFPSSEKTPPSLGPSQLQGQPSWETTVLATGAMGGGGTEVETVSTAAQAQGSGGDWLAPPPAAGAGTISLHGGNCTAGGGGSGGSTNIWGESAAGGDRGEGVSASAASLLPLTSPSPGYHPVPVMVDAFDEMPIPMSVNACMPGGMDGQSSSSPMLVQLYGLAPPEGADTAALPQGAGTGSFAAAAAAATDAMDGPSPTLLHALAKAARKLADHVDPALGHDGHAFAFPEATGHSAAATAAWVERADAAGVAPSQLPTATAEARGYLFDVGAAAAGGGGDGTKHKQLASGPSIAVPPPPPSLAGSDPAAVTSWTPAQFPTTLMLDEKDGPADRVHVAVRTAVLVDPPIDGGEPPHAGGGAPGRDPATGIVVDGGTAATAANAAAVFSSIDTTIAAVPEHSVTAKASALSKPISSPGSPPLWQPSPAQRPDALDLRRAAARRASAKSRNNHREKLKNLTSRFNALSNSAEMKARKEMVKRMVKAAGRVAGQKWDSKFPPPESSRCKHKWQMSTRGQELARLRTARNLAKTDSTAGNAKSEATEDMNNAFKLVSNQRSSFVVKAREKALKDILEKELKDQDTAAISGGGDSDSSIGGSGSGNGGSGSGNGGSGSGNGDSGSGNGGSGSGNGGSGSGNGNGGSPPPTHPPPP